MARHGCASGPVLGSPNIGFDADAKALNWRGAWRVEAAGADVGALALFLGRATPRNAATVCGLRSSSTSRKEIAADIFAMRLSSRVSGADALRKPRASMFMSPEILCRLDS